MTIRAGDLIRRRHAYGRVLSVRVDVADVCWDGETLSVSEHPLHELMPAQVRKPHEFHMRPKQGLLVDWRVKVWTTVVSTCETCCCDVVRLLCRGQTSDWPGEQRWGAHTYGSISHGFKQYCTACAELAKEETQP